MTLAPILKPLPVTPPCTANFPDYLLDKPSSLIEDTRRLFHELGKYTYGMVDIRLNMKKICHLVPQQQKRLPYLLLFRGQLLSHKSTFPMKDVELGKRNIEAATQLYKAPNWSEAQTRMIHKQASILFASCGALKEREIEAVNRFFRSSYLSTMFSQSYMEQLSVKVSAIEKKILQTSQSVHHITPLPFPLQNSGEIYEEIEQFHKDVTLLKLEATLLLKTMKSIKSIENPLAYELYLILMRLNLSYNLQLVKFMDRSPFAKIEQKIKDFDQPQEGLCLEEELVQRQKQKEELEELQKMLAFFDNALKKAMKKIYHTQNEIACLLEKNYAVISFMYKDSIEQKKVFAKPLDHKEELPFGKPALLEFDQLCNDINMLQEQLNRLSKLITNEKIDPLVACKIIYSLNGRYENCLTQMDRGNPETIHYRANPVVDSTNSEEKKFINIRASQINRTLGELYSSFAETAALIRGQNIDVKYRYAITSTYITAQQETIIPIFARPPTGKYIELEQDLVGTRPQDQSLVYQPLTMVDLPNQSVEFSHLIEELSDLREKLHLYRAMFSYFDRTNEINLYIAIEFAKLKYRHSLTLGRKDNGCKLARKAFKEIDLPSWTHDEERAITSQLQVLANHIDNSPIISSKSIQEVQEEIQKKRDQNLFIYQQLEKQRELFNNWDTDFDWKTGYTALHTDTSASNGIPLPSDPWCVNTLLPFILARARTRWLAAILLHQVEHKHPNSISPDLFTTEFIKLHTQLESGYKDNIPPQINEKLKTEKDDLTISFLHACLARIAISEGQILSSMLRVKEAFSSKSLPDILTLEQYQTKNKKE